jgi:moderate conductance mechanosensitive channel
VTAVYDARVRGADHCDHIGGRTLVTPAGTTVEPVDIVRSTEPCYEEQTGLCRQVYDWTDGNETAANLASWIVDKPLEILIILVVAWVLARLARRWVERFVNRVVVPTTSPVERLGKLGVVIPGGLEAATPDPRRSSRAQSISVVLTSSTVVAIWSIAGMLVLGVVGIQLGPLLAGAGVAGVALGFGAQSLVKDCIAGLFMLIEDQYGVGDVIDLGEATGVVEEVSLRTTVLRSVDGTVWHVPNGVVERVGNLSQLWSVALIDVVIAYDTDVNRACELLQEAADEVGGWEEFEGVIIEAPRVLGVETLAADGVTIRLTVKVTPGQQWQFQRALRQHVKEVFDRADVAMPFPQRTVWMNTDPDRASRTTPSDRNNDNDRTD